MVDAVPPVYADRIIPYLMIDGAAAAIDFYSAAFGAREQYRMPMPDGTVGHAEIVVHWRPQPASCTAHLFHRAARVHLGSP